MNEKMEKFFNTLRDKSNDKFNPLIEWQVVVDSLTNLVGRCICGTEISRNFVIKNMINGNTLIVGSKCVEKWGFTVTCIRCNRVLRDVSNRLKDDNWICPACKRADKKLAKLQEAAKEALIKKLGGYTLYHSGKYYKARFSDVVEDLSYTQWLYNINCQTKTLTYFRQYVDLVCDVVEEEESA